MELFAPQVAVTVSMRLQLAKYKFKTNLTLNCKSLSQLSCYKPWMIFLIKLTRQVEFLYHRRTDLNAAINWNYQNAHPAA